MTADDDADVNADVPADLNVAGAVDEPRPGDFTLRQFLRRYWQRKPLLVRDALHLLPEPGLPTSHALHAALDLQSLVTTRALFTLARDPDVESRLVLAPSNGAHAAAGSEPVPGTAAARERTHPSGWQLRHGPFNRLPPRRQPGWSLLVQGVDLHVPAARRLMDRFRFLPDARLDDLMISFATDGGGVGPHVDSYDVFLLQLAGHRRWRISSPGRGALVPGAPLRLLADFEAEQEWLLGPGDMLYLPPGWGHDGTAVGECMTCSIGFRSPSKSELHRAFFSYLADQLPPESSAPGAPEARYRDRTKDPVAHPAEIPGDMARSLGGWVRRYRPPGKLIERFIGCYLTEPKPSVWFDAEGEAAPMTLDAGAARGATLRLDRRTRMLYRKRVFYVNGEAVEVPPRNRPARVLLEALADQRGLDRAQTARAARETWLRKQLEEWLAAGWLRLSVP